MKRQPWFWPVKRFIKRISGKKLWLKTDVKYRLIESGGWLYTPDLLGPDSTVYSLGVGDSIEFDLHLIEHYGLTVHAFDPTPFSEEWMAGQALPSNLEFHNWAAAGEDGSLRLFRRVSKRGRKSKVIWTAEGQAGGDSE